MCFIPVVTDKMENKKFWEYVQDISVPDKCGANIVRKMHYFLLLCVADVELTAFNERQMSRQI